MKFLYHIICISLVIMLVGCGSSKQASTTTPALPQQFEGDSTYLLLKHLGDATSKYKEWNDVVIPIELSLSQPKEFSVTGRATMVKDESIYISIRVFGFEAANIYLNNDSIYATYKLNKLYIAEDIKKLFAGYPVTIGNIQDLLLGRAFVVGKGTLNYEMKDDLTLKLTSSSDLWSVTPNQNLKKGYYIFLFATNCDMLKMLTINIDKYNPINCIYDNTPTTPLGLSNSAQISTTIKDTPINAEIKWDLDRAKWNSGAKPNWKAPKGYNQVDASALIKAF